MAHLNCSNYTSALISTSNILSLHQDQLIEILKLIPDSQELSNQYDQCFDELLQYLNYEPKQLTATWFHGTRIINVDSFFEDGLKPKSEAYRTLTPLLKNLASNIEHTKSSSSSFGLSKMGKASLAAADEGPFATLFKQKAQHKDYPFHLMPEAVEDIAEGLVGANHPLVTDKFFSITRPALVEFTGHADDSELISSLYYLHQIIHDENETEVVYRINAYFNGKGKTVPRQKIKQIHFLDRNEIIPNQHWDDTFV
jgi:hypothetical protein